MIQIENLGKTFRTEEVETIALQDINLRIDDGEFVAIMGPSGCGKSTLLNIIGLLDNPSEGSYLLNGQEVARLTEDERTGLRRGTIGFVFQSFNLIDEMTVYENVELPLIYAGVPAKERRERVEALLDRMKMSHRAKHYPQQLSGGQQQRVAIARAVVTRPQLILADEPTGNLDSASSKEILGILKKLHAGGRTVILITHDDGIASQAKRVVRIMDGKIETDRINPEYEETEYDKAEENHEEGNIEE